MPEHGRIDYDLAVIGGGIAGAAVARDASLRGLKTVLFERSTFASGASGKSSRLIHGGIRYLELSWQALKKFRIGEAWKNLTFVFFSLHESRSLAKLAPELIRPIRLVIPLYRNDRRSRLAVRTGVWLYYLLARLSGPAVPPKFFGSREEILAEVPQLDPEGLKGGVAIWDHLTQDRELVLQTLAAACRHGAVCHEDAVLTGCQGSEDQGFFEISVRIKGIERSFRVRHLVNATGAWIDRTSRLETSPFHERILPVAGTHIHLKRFLPVSTLLQSADGRIFFVINIGDEARIGTTEWLIEDPDRAIPRPEDIDYLLKELRRYFPGVSFKAEDILRADAGVRPLARDRAVHDPHGTSREHRIERSESGVIYMLGVKLTDHRRAAQKAVDLISHRPCRTTREPLSV